MKELLRRYVPFFSAIALAGFLLDSLPSSPRTVALSKLQKEQLVSEGISQVTEQCSALTSTEAPLLAKHLSKVLALRETGRKGCELHIADTHFERLHLLEYWNFALKVDGISSPLLRNHAVTVPRPLALLPLVAFFLAVVFRISGWGLPITTCGLVLTLNGLNLPQTFHSIQIALTPFLMQDLSLTAYALLALWFVIFRSVRSSDHSYRIYLPPKFSGPLSWLVGLWNPLVFTLIGPLLPVGKRAIRTLADFCNLQTFLLCVSLYLFSAENSWGSLPSLGTLATPRYFSMGLILWLWLDHRPKQRSRNAFSPPIPFGIDGFWLARVAAMAALVEFCVFVAGLDPHVPTLLRISIALLLSELVALPRLSLWTVLKQVFPFWGALIVGFALSNLLSNSTVLESTFSGLSPLAHPTAAGFFLFLLGLFMGVCMGQFAFSFFLIANTFSVDTPLTRAALMEGTLAGVLLCPYSLLNWIPTLHLSTHLHVWMRERWRLISPPLAIGFCIYATSILSSVAILQPVTFLFLCLLAIAVQWSRRQWKIWDPQTLNFDNTAT